MEFYDVKQYLMGYKDYLVFSTGSDYRIDRNKQQHSLSLWLYSGRSNCKVLSIYIGDLKKGIDITFNRALHASAIIYNHILFEKWDREKRTLYLNSFKELQILFSLLEENGYFREEEWINYLWK